MASSPGSKTFTVLSGTEKSDPADDFDYLDKPELYFTNLEKLKLHAENIQKIECSEEKALMEFLPVNEKFSFNKEGKVLTKWQERQRDWDRIQTQIQRKINSKIKKPLMMSTTDEFRAKLEELDLVQASIPIEERFNETTWQTQLRGGGAIRVSVGHIFSGLECEYETKPPNPKLVRKPKPNQYIGRNDIFVDQSSTYLLTKKKFDKNYRDLRPHDLAYSDANNLVIRSTNLFKWAKDSSEHYFNKNNNQLLYTLNEEQSVNNEESILSLGGNSEVKSADTIGSSIQFISSKEISFDAMIAKSCTKTVEFRNNGTVSLLYKWRLLTQDSIEPGKEAQTDKSRITIITEQQRPGTAGDKSTLKEILAGRGMSELSSIRSHVITQHRDSFFCCKDVGEILPDEVVSTTFIFSSRAGGGSFTSQWILEFIPDDTTILNTYQYMSQNQVPSVGFIVCNLHGYCYIEDESSTKRKFVSNYIEQSSIIAMAKDIVFNCLRRVRDPVRLKDIHHRQSELFRIINKDLLLMINSKYTSAIPIFITPERLNKFCEIYNQASYVFTNVTSTLVNLQNKRKVWMSKDEITQKLFQQIYENPLVMSSITIEQIKLKLFPEQVIDLFDEITEEKYFPHWNYDLSSILSCMTELLVYAEKVGELESEINVLEAIDLKTKLKAQRKEERLAALDSDEEYEEVEDEEEEEADEEEEKHVHPYIIEVQSLIASVYSGINVLVIHPLPSDVIHNIATEIIIDIADLIVSSHEKSLQQANIVDVITQGGIIPTIPSPFTSLEGEEQWKDILNVNVVVTEVDPKSKGAKTAAKPVKGAPVVTNVELSKDQVNAFYKAMYDEVHNSLLDVTLNMFTKINEYLVHNSPISYKDHKASKDSLFDISVPRKSDLKSVYSGKVAFMSWNGNAFNELQSSIKSAFNVKQSNKESAIKPIMKLIEHEAQAIVLFYEPNLTSIPSNETLVSILANFDEIKELIEQKYKDYMIKNNKILKQNKVKPGYYKQLSFSMYKSFAEFYYNMSQLLNRSDYEVYFSEYLPIILLETISIPGVVPIEPTYEEVVSDDDDAPVTIGIEESILQKHQKFESKKPYRVKVPIEISKKSSSKVTNNYSLIEIECYADTVSAISEAYFMKPNSKPFDIMWMEACPNKLFDPNSSFELLNINSRYVSEEIREMMLWCGIFQTIQNIPFYLSIEDESESKQQILRNDQDNDISINIMHTMYQNDTSDKSNIKAHLTKLFPYSDKSKEIPNSIGIIAGNIRADKFCVLDQLIDSVDTIYLAGEMALAFISLSKRLLFKKYNTELNKYTDACIAIISKAKMKGCSLILPIDLLCGEERINIDEKMKCYNKFELDCRNEGGEYEGDTKVYDIYELDEMKIIDGYAYDIGPKSCQILKDILIKSELLLVWGTIGVCEISTFQNGQQVLVDHSTNKVDDNTDNNKDNNLLRNPLHTILFGDSTVEWYTRIIDSDGELNGDLVSAGIVTYLHRDSTLLAGIMGLFHSSIIQNKLKFRPCNDYEWIYSAKRIELDDDDEEDEDD